MSTTFNILDLIFITFTIIFVLTAFFRGFVKEIFALFNWIVALTLSYLLAPYAAELASKYFKNKLVVDISMRSIIFILVFFTTAMSTANLCDTLKKKMPKMFDCSLGVLFGFVKTLIICGFIYSLYFTLYGFLLGGKLKEGGVKTPDWLRDAKCYSLLKFSGETLDPLVKKFFDAATENLDRVVPNSKEVLDKKIDEVIEEKAEEAMSEQLDKSDIDAGYNKKDIEKMNHLIDIIDK